MFHRNLRAYLNQHTNDPDLRVFSAREAEEGMDSAGGPVAEARYAPPLWVEHETVMAIHVDRPQETSFTHFLDGIQRKASSGIERYVPEQDITVPIFHAHTAAVIRARNHQRQMHTWRGRRSDDSLYFPFVYVDCNEFRSFGLSVVDTYATEEPEEDYQAIKDKASKVVKRNRQSLEATLAQEWITDLGRAPDCWLLIDGSLTDYVDSHRTANAVGVIKSHRMSFFRQQDQMTILRLQPGERSSVFKIKGHRDRKAFSWYLRLHPNRGRDAYFGLIRIEVPPDDDFVARADEISGWLLAERYPLSLPDSRWDRLIYPIRDCEEYLRSLAPTRVMMEAAFSGL